MGTGQRCYQDVDVACQIRRGRGQRPHAVDVTEVSGEEIGTAAGAANLGHGGVAACFSAAADDDMGATGGELLGDGSADAACAAGD
jgi:hypothetical protein